MTCLLQPRKCYLPLTLLLFTFYFLLLTFPTLAGDWTSWRGPEQNGVSRETGIPENFGIDPKDPNSNIIWKAPYGMRSTPIVMNGRVYINNQVGEKINEQERVMCLDADTGKLIWEKRFPVFHTDIVSVRLGWGNLAGDPNTGNIYWHGTQGLFVCFDKDGKILWQRSLTEEFGRVSGYGGRINSPTIFEDFVIIGMLNFSWGSHAKGTNRYLAMDKHNGDIIWWWESPHKPKDTYYSVPIISVVNGQQVLITGGGDGHVHCMNVRSGEHVWSYPITKGGVNPSPVMDGNYVYFCHGAENAEETNEKGGVFCFDARQVKDGKPKLVWQELGIACSYVSPLLHEGRLFVCTDVARMHCLDAKTGKKLWRRPVAYGRNAKGSPVWADGRIYVPAVNGSFAIIDPGKTKGTIINEIFFPSPDGITPIEINGTPAVANGRLYFGTSHNIYCVGDKDQKDQPVHLPPEPSEAPPGKPDSIRVEPAEVTVYPGDTLKFKIRVLDANGRVLDVAPKEVAWSIPVPPPPPKVKAPLPKLKAKFVNDGVIVVDPDVPSQAGVIEVKADKFTAQARVRVAPRLPYSEEFNDIPDGLSPISWINCQGKFFVATLPGGEKALRNNNKVASALVSKAETYIGMPDLSNLTIQADVMGTSVVRKNSKGEVVGSDLPDMGVIANRYRLLLWGNKQVLRLDAWDAMPRLAVATPYEVQEDVWYRLKLKVQIEGDKAQIQGKAWKRDEKEPAGWQITFTDPTPNREGSPGLYRFGAGVLENQPGADVYFDNVKITPNK